MDGWRTVDGWVASGGWWWGVWSRAESPGRLALRLAQAHSCPCSGCHASSLVNSLAGFHRISWISWRQWREGRQGKDGLASAQAVCSAASVFSESVLQQTLFISHPLCCQNCFPEQLTLSLYTKRW